MRSLKDLKRRIGAAKGTQKITRAMKLIAASRLRPAQLTLLEARPYSKEAYLSVERISKTLGPGAPIEWQRPKTFECIDILVVTSDRGFCGGFNEDLLRLVESGISDVSNYKIHVRLYTIGKKGFKYLKQRGYDVTEVPDQNDVEKATFWASDELKRRILGGESSGSNVAFNRFVSTSKFKPTFWNLLPLHFRGEEHAKPREYRYEPDMYSALDFISTGMIRSTIRRCILESKAAELAARVIAMTGASKNAEDMISHLTSLYNRARQESITLELLDIVGGAQVISG